MRLRVPRRAIERASFTAPGALQKGSGARGIQGGSCEWELSPWLCGCAVEALCRVLVRKHGIDL